MGTPIYYITGNCQIYECDVPKGQGEGQCTLKNADPNENHANDRDLAMSCKDRSCSISTVPDERDDPQEILKFSLPSDAVGVYSVGDDNSRFRFLKSWDIEHYKENLKGFCAATKSDGTIKVPGIKNPKIPPYLLDIGEAAPIPMVNIPVKDYKLGTSIAKYLTSLEDSSGLIQHPVAVVMYFPEKLVNELNNPKTKSNKLQELMDHYLSKGIYIFPYVVQDAVFDANGGPTRTNIGDTVTIAYLPASAFKKGIPAIDQEKDAIEQNHTICKTHIDPLMRTEKYQKIYSAYLSLAGKLSFAKE